MPDPATADVHGIVGVGADLEPGTLLAAYRTGIFPMRIRRRTLAWWSPDPRGVLPLDGLHESRSLRRSRRRFELRVDTAFEAVMRACADPPRAGRWIDESFVGAYTRLFELGYAHSFESWHEVDGEHRLAGGLYGVAIDRFFAGESMFHRARDAGKVALAGTVDWLRARGFVLFDVQWATPHLESLGVIEIPRAEYLSRLAVAVGPP
jgi:leucyl/phenylalanyl-tRNA--protein transferase